MEKSASRTFSSDPQNCKFSLSVFMLARDNKNLCSISLKEVTESQKMWFEVHLRSQMLQGSSFVVHEIISSTCQYVQP